MTSEIKTIEVQQARTDLQKRERLIRKLMDWFRRRSRSRLSEKAMRIDGPDGAANEAGMNIWERLSSLSFHSSTEAMAYFRRVIDNICINRNEHHNAQKRNPKESIFSIDATTQLTFKRGQPVVNTTPSEIAMRNEEAANIRGAIEQLPIKQQIVLEGFCNGLNNREIAQLIDLSESQVSRILKSARQHLEEACREQHDA